MIRAIRQQRLRLRRWIKAHRYDWNAIHVGVIVSTGRTGTNFVESLFSAILRDVDTRHEPRPDLFTLGTARMRGDITEEQANIAFRDQRLDICEELHQAKRTHYVEANNNIAYLLPQVQHCWPHARIIHLVRDGRDFVRSSYSKKVVSKHSNDLTALFMTDDDKRRRLQACDLPDDPYCKAWPTMSRFERICWYWAMKDAQIMEALADREKTLTIKFERLFDPDTGTACVLEMLEFLDLSDRLRVKASDIANHMQRRVNKTDEYLLPASDQWTDEQKTQFDRIAGAHMRRMGYSA